MNSKSISTADGMMQFLIRRYKLYK
ncbi:hypothetical protein [Piscirickettsia salmonis]